VGESSKRQRQQLVRTVSVSVSESKSSVSDAVLEHVFDDVFMKEFDLVCCVCYTFNKTCGMARMNCCGGKSHICLDCATKCVTMPGQWDVDGKEVVKFPVCHQCRHEEFTLAITEPNNPLDVVRAMMHCHDRSKQAGRLVSIVGDRHVKIPCTRCVQGYHYTDSEALECHTVTIKCPVVRCGQDIVLHWAHPHRLTLVDQVQVHIRSNDCGDGWKCPSCQICAQNRDDKRWITDRSYQSAHEGLHRRIYNVWKHNLRSAWSEENQAPGLLTLYYSNWQVMLYNYHTAQAIIGGGLTVLRHLVENVNPKKSDTKRAAMSKFMANMESKAVSCQDNDAELIAYCYTALFESFSSV
jgi:hypothetical protein